MSSSRTSGGSSERFVVKTAEEVDLMAMLEVARWELRGQGPSRLPAELAAASERLARHPCIGTRTTEHGDVYRLLLDRTPYVLFYVIDEADGVVRIFEMMHAHDRRARRGPR